MSTHAVTLHINHIFQSSLCSRNLQILQIPSASKMANQLYGQRGLSSIYNNTTAATTTTSSRSAIDSTSFLSAPYLPTFPDPHSHSTDPSPPSLFSLSDPTPSTFGDSFRSTANIPGLVAAASAGSRGIASAAATATSTALWNAFDVSSALAKRPFEALYDKSVVGAHMLGQSEAWLASDSLAKRPRLESTSDLPIYPQRPGEKDCAHYMLTRTCKFGYNCKFDHPVWVPAGGMPDWKELPPVPPESHPERPGEPDCPYFLKTKSCKFGLNCKFNHPKELGTSGNSSDLPERPSEPPCSFYMKTGKCKFGAACKFHHPKDIPIPLETGSVEQTNSVVDVGMISDSNAVKPFTSSSAAASYNSKGLPIRLGETDCPFYMKTSSCKYGANCRYNHPDRNEFYTPFSVVNSPASAIGHSLLSSPFGLVNPAASVLQHLGQTMFGLGLPAVYPQRPGQIECDYYMKSGECKFVERCKFHHPVDRSASKLTLAGLPRREGVLQCPYYMKTGTCSYGASCKFDHPPPGEVLAAVAGKETSASALEEGKLHGENVSVEEGKKNEDV